MASKRHPALIGTAPGVFQPSAVGIVPGYPRTLETYNAQRARLRANSTGARAAGLMNRKGSPNGFKGQRDRVVALREAALKDAWKLVSAAAFGSARLPAERLDELAAGPQSGRTPARTGDERGAVCLAHLLCCIISPTYAVTDRLRAAKVALPYLLALPRGAVATLPDGMAFLRGLAKDSAKDR